MYTVSTLARLCGLSRTTLLYYESLGLVRPPRRTAANYRVYGEAELERLRQIAVYRGAGLKLADIRGLLDRAGNDASVVLTRRLREISREIDTLRGHQQAILKLLHNRSAFRRNQVITKDKWVSIMRGAGFTEEDMHRWHVEFERSAPAEHQEFLEFLHIPSDEIAGIRAWSRKG